MHSLRNNPLLLCGSWGWLSTALCLAETMNIQPETLLEQSPGQQPARVCWPPALCPSPGVHPLSSLVSSHCQWLTLPSTGYCLNTCASLGPVSFPGLQGDTYSQLGSTTQDLFLKAGADTPPFTDLTRADSFLSESIHSSFSVITQNLELWSKSWGSQICWVMGFKSVLAHQVVQWELWEFPLHFLKIGLLCSKKLRLWSDREAPLQIWLWFSGRGK